MQSIHIIPNFLPKRGEQLDWEKKDGKETSQYYCYLKKKSKARKDEAKCILLVLHMPNNIEDAFLQVPQMLLAKSLARPRFSPSLAYLPESYHSHFLFRIRVESPN